MDTQSLKSQLLEERAQLEKEMNDLGVRDPETGDWSVIGEPDGEEADKNDMGDRDEDFAAKADTLSQLELRYHDVTDALTKIDANNGSYGKCSACGNAIEHDRLGANPAAKTCKEHM